MSLGSWELVGFCVFHKLHGADGNQLRDAAFRNL